MYYLCVCVDSSPFYIGIYCRDCFLTCVPKKLIVYIIHLYHAVLPTVAPPMAPLGTLYAWARQCSFTIDRFFLSKLCTPCVPHDLQQRCETTHPWLLLVFVMFSLYTHRICRMVYVQPFSLCLWTMKPLPSWSTDPVVFPHFCLSLLRQQVLDVSCTSTPKIITSNIHTLANACLVSIRGFAGIHSWFLNLHPSYSCGTILDNIIKKHIWLSNPCGWHIWLHNIVVELHWPSLRKDYELVKEHVEQLNHQPW